MAKQIEPRILKGFRDYLPELMIPREQLLDTVRRVYRSYGFAPIDTPALEYTEILMGKGGEESDKLMYRFQDNGGRDVSLRFDLTVPFARFAAMHVAQLGTPFKRYHLGPVWRGENTGHGRFREFWQCDFDTIGTTSNASDIETALVIHDLMHGIGFEDFEIRVNNRLILNGFLELHNLQDKAVPILRALDKLPKIGQEKVISEMVQEAGVTPGHAHTVLELTEVPDATGPYANAKRLTFVQQFFDQTPNEKAAEGIRRLRELLSVTKEAGIPEERIKIDFSICRGLDYYTGTIYETFLLDKPDIGSVCSGGRYDDLAGLYTNQKLPGVGASLGLDRLLAAMDELDRLPRIATPAPVLIVQFDAGKLGTYQKMARTLRAEGIGVEVYPEAKKPGAQFKYADQRGFKLALIAGPDECARGVWKLKNLTVKKTGEKAENEETIPDNEVAAAVRRTLELLDE
jgi:histidyl-tRNA synthetase